ncbi:MAG: hypothetical protein JSR77_12685, partial [Planctomycetes bacterium]|nr:hypothetical protein [Planctomycetota bacterium]
AIIAMLMGILLPSLGKARGLARQLKDCTQVRSIHQGMVLFAQNNGDAYPIPTRLDKSTTNPTVPVPFKKDVPRHVMSVLIYNGYFPPELCVSTAESNANIKVYDKYQYSEPQAVTGDKRLALWDPAFRAVPKDEQIGWQSPVDPGGCSYAINTFFGGRGAAWSNTFQSSEAVIGNRGPSYILTQQTGAWTLNPTLPDTSAFSAECGVRSNTLLIHGGRTTWEGNIAYNDNHVNFETRPDPETSPWTFTGISDPNNRAKFDNLFVNENDHDRMPNTANLSDSDGLANRNNYLRTWWNIQSPFAAYPSLSLFLD